MERIEFNIKLFDAQILWNFILIKNGIVCERNMQIAYSLSSSSSSTSSTSTSGIQGLRVITGISQLWAVIKNNGYNIIVFNNNSRPHIGCNLAFIQVSGQSHNIPERHHQPDCFFDALFFRSYSPLPVGFHHVSIQCAQKFGKFFHIPHTMNITISNYQRFFGTL